MSEEVVRFHCRKCGKETEHVVLEKTGTQVGFFYWKLRCKVCGFVPMAPSSQIKK